MNAAHRFAARAIAGLLLAACALLLLVSVALSHEGQRTEAFAASGRGVSAVTEIPLATGDVDVNGGDQKELERLSGVGSALSQAILEERALHGAFYYPEDLMNVRGIGEKTLAGFRDSVDLTGPAAEEVP